MNTECELTLFDLFKEAGTPGLISFWGTVFMLGLLGVKRRFWPGACRALTLVAILPAIVGVCGVRYLVMTFRDPNGHYTPNVMDRYISSGEAFMPLMVGCFVPAS